jgi:short-subunit dehydrogenase
MESLAAEIANQCACIHLLVNNAGVSLAGPFEKFDIEDFEWLMGANFWGAIYACKYFLPLLRKASEARICNILSGFALIGFPMKSAYAASKFGVRGFSESLEMELHASNVGVTCIYLGAVRTGLVRSGRAWDDAKQLAEAEFLARNGMPTASAARQICRAIVADRRRVRIGWTTFVFDGLARLIPALTPRIIGAAKNLIRFV